MKLSLQTILLFLSIFLSTKIYASSMSEKRSARYVYKHNPLCRALAEKAPFIRPDNYPAALIINLEKPCFWDDSSEPAPDRRIRVHVMTMLLNKMLEAGSLYEHEELDEQ